MNDSQKASLFEEAKNHVHKSTEAIKQELQKTEELLVEIAYKIKNPPKGVEAHVAIAHRDLYTEHLELNKEIIEKLNIIKPSPYFIRCDVKFDQSSSPRSLYFAKENLLKEQIFSWIVPAAKIRFEEIGRFTYTLPDGRKQSGELLRKDQFMIVDGKITFMSSESKNWQRQLIYQEYLSNRKSGFMLREIIEVMDKAQDIVIRAYHKGSFLISGPAGSGKTTLALHRVAYLTQSPETTNLYPGKSIIVFVQDSSTQKYFSAILPQLGINNVTITTFADWAFERLELDNRIKFVIRFGENEAERDILEFSKNKILDKDLKIHYFDNPFDTLEKIYKENLNEKYFEQFQSQRSQNVLDRFDLTLLLKAYISKFGNLTKKQMEFKKAGNKKFKEVIERIPLNYSLIIADEVQNYLPEQIKILQSCINPQTKSMLYVGDLAQQTHLCTLKDWNKVNEIFHEERKVELQKVYRNTKQILEYIASIGYKVTIPNGIHEGNEVVEKKFESKNEEINYIEKILTENKNEIVGILGKTHEYLEEFKKKFGNKDKTHILTINEAQGVEFDIVIIVGVNKELFEVQKSNEFYENELIKEKKQVNKDLLYVALTRSMSQLHILGKDKIKEIISLQN